MHQKVEPLLCELHAHTMWSDGALSLADLVDLYGRNGFDVLCVTDHVTRIDDPWWVPGLPPRNVHAGNQAVYFAEVQAQAERAAREYDLLLLPGLELTYNDLDPFLAAHALAVGCRVFIPVDDGIEPALGRARSEGAAGYRRSRTATSIVPSTCPAGRRCCPAQRTSALCSITSARRGRRSSRASTPPKQHCFARRNVRRVTFR